MKNIISLLALVLSLVLVIAASGCEQAAQQGLTSAPWGAGPRPWAGTGVLLYSGDGAAQPDVAAIADILEDHGVDYDTVTSNALDNMSVDEIAKYGTLVWPGGYAGVASSSLDPATRSRVREAVRVRGVNYAGFCAGAFIAMNTTPDAGRHPAYGFSLLHYDGILPEYEPGGVHQHDHPETETFTLAGGTTQDMVWFGGPFFPGASEVLARYVDGTPAMIQADAGAGFAVLSGPHPETPSAWMDGGDRDGPELDRELAWRLIQAAMTRERLPTF